MLQSTFKIAARSVFKNKTLSSLHILCLVVGMTSSMLLLNYVFFELSYDQFHEHKDRIYRLVVKYYNKQDVLINEWATTPYTHGQAIAENFPEVEGFIRVRIPGGVGGMNTVSYENHEFHENNIFFTDSTFLKYFSFKVVKGNPKTMLNNIYSVALTRSTAKKYFGNEDPMNKMLKFKSINNEYTCTVTGILEDAPENSSMHFDMLVSFSTFMFQDQNRLLNNWDRHSFVTYVLLSPDADAKTLPAKYNPYLNERMSKTLTDPFRFEYLLQPLTDIHLYSDYEYEIFDMGNKQMVYFLLITAVLLLLISLINYTNLSTATAITKSKEVSIRKLLGSNRRLIIMQFLFETMVISATAFLLSVIIVIFLKPHFDDFVGKHVPYIVLSNPIYGLILISLFVVCITISGLYPAFMLSVLKSMSTQGVKIDIRQFKPAIAFRRFLTVFQFGIALLFIVSTFIIYLQIKFIADQDPGFNMKQILVLKAPVKRDSIFEASAKNFISDVRGQKNIIMISKSNGIPGTENFDKAIYFNDTERGRNELVLAELYGDHNFLNTYEFTFLAGRNFTEDAQADKQAVIINEEALKELSIKGPKEALGEQIENWGTQYTIIGVVKNHFHESMKEDVFPIVFRLEEFRRISHFSVKINSVDVEETVEMLRSKWSKYFTDPFESFFQDEYFNRKYDDDRRFGKINGLSSVLVIILSCLGILGLTYFDSQQKTRDISIRKVLGARTTDIMVVLSKELMLLIAIANIVAIPVALIVMDSYLSNFVRQVDISWWIFADAACIVFAVAIVTMIYHFLLIMRKNPVDALREN